MSNEENEITEAEQTLLTVTKAQTLRDAMISGLVEVTKGDITETQQTQRSVSARKLHLLSRLIFIFTLRNIDHKKDILVAHHLYQGSSCFNSHVLLLACLEYWKGDPCLTHAIF